MRPIVKKKPGDRVRYVDSRGNVVDYVVKKDYEPYGEAKFPLVGNLGRYCSYCERLLDMDSMEVEHVKARCHGGSETDWDNFLLSCKVCNTVKSQKWVGADVHWPHLNNTFLDFVYEEDGRVKLNPDLSGLSRTRAQNLYDLVRLGRDDKDATAKDFRWLNRYEAWNKARDAKGKYIAGKWSVEDVMDKAKLTGYWSVWFTAFEGIDAVRSRLISDFPGTCADCFDAAHHYAPVPRHPADVEDPV